MASLLPDPLRCLACSGDADFWHICPGCMGKMSPVDGHYKVGESPFGDRFVCYRTAEEKARIHVEMTTWLGYSTLPVLSDRIDYTHEYEYFLRALLNWLQAGKPDAPVANHEVVQFIESSGGSMMELHLAERDLSLWARVLWRRSCLAYLEDKHFGIDIGETWTEIERHAAELARQEKARQVEGLTIPELVQRKMEDDE